MLRSILLKFTLTGLSLILASLLIQPTVYAAVELGVRCPPDQTYIGVFDRCLDFGTAVSWGLTTALVIGSMVALIKFIIGAVNYITASGDPAKLENARTTIYDAVLGLVLIMAAWVLLGYVSGSFPSQWKISLFNLPFGFGGPTS